MVEREEVAIFAAKILAGTVFVLVFVFGLVSEEWSFGILVGALGFSFIFWIIGFLFTVVLLWPLEKIFSKVSETQALLIFLIVGTLVPVTLLASVNFVVNALVSDEEIGFADSVFIYGALGAITATSAWWYLTNRDVSKNGN